LSFITPGLSPDQRISQEDPQLIESSNMNIHLTKGTGHAQAERMFRKLLHRLLQRLDPALLALPLCASDDSSYSRSHPDGYSNKVSD
jgi:predicted GTPase